MRYFRFARLFLSLLGTQNVYRLTDQQGNKYTDPPIHFWKTRVSISTAFSIAKLIHG